MLIDKIFRFLNEFHAENAQILIIKFPLLNYFSNTSQKQNKYININTQAQFLSDLNFIK